MADRAQKSDAPQSPLGLRLLWFAGLWIAGIASVGAVSLAIKWALK